LIVLQVTYENQQGTANVNANVNANGNANENVNEIMIGIGSVIVDGLEIVESVVGLPVQGLFHRRIRDQRS
jgi:hypothetical protein